MDERLLQAEAIVFDIGNVLLEFDLKKVALLVPEAMRAAMIEAMFGPRHLWSPFDLGIESNLLIAQRIAQGAGFLGCEDVVLHALHHFHETMNPLPLAGMLGALRQQGKKLYGLTNYPEPSYTFTAQQFPFLENALDGVVVSAREKLVKPDPAIFHLIRERYSLIPERTLFIDDTLENVESARREGFQVWHYHGDDRL